MTQSGHALWEKHPHVRTGADLTFGERAADVMRSVFGSWSFVGGFLAFMAAWMAVNSWLLPHLQHRHAPDPYPYILLNLSLSMMAGLQGALILIAAKRADRVAAEQATAHYAETRQLHDLTEQIHDLTEQQMTMLAQLAEIAAAVRPRPAAAPAGKSRPRRSK